MTANTITHTTCYHCGEECDETHYQLDDKDFCCLGCRSVYQVLSKSGLCNYYSYNEHPGANRAHADKRFEYLDNPEIARELVNFSDGQMTIINLYIPDIHCSSCIWLLEQMHRLNPDIYYSRVDFLKKQVNIRFATGRISLREVVELLTDIGYEPLISL